MARYRVRAAPRQAPEDVIETLTWLLLAPGLLLAWTHLVAVVGWAVRSAEGGQPVRLDATTVAVLFREGSAHALLRVIAPLGWGHRAPTSAGLPDARRAPVLLVPGLGWGRASLWFLRRFLVTRGWRWAWAVNRAASGGTLATEAESLALRVEELKRASGAEQIDLVAFAGGGLVAAWYLRHHPDGPGSVRRLVTLATPWRGTRMAVFGRSQPTRELLPGSHVLDDLWPPPVPTVCIWSADDLVVVPASSAAPEDAAESVCIEAAGHIELLASARAFRAVQGALEHPLTDPQAVAS